MKIEIDLDDIIGDEEGVETLQDSVRRQVIDQITAIIKKGVGHRIETEVARVLNSELQTAVAAKMPEIVEDVLSTEYVPVDQWGDRRKGATTFRKELVATIVGQVSYKKAQYDSEKNAFTRAVDDLISEQVKTFKAMFDKEVNAQFTTQAMNYAAAKLREKLGIPA